MLPTMGSLRLPPLPSSTSSSRSFFSAAPKLATANSSSSSPRDDVPGEVGVGADALGAAVFPAAQGAAQAAAAAAAAVAHAREEV